MSPDTLFELMGSVKDEETFLRFVEGLSIERRASENLAPTLDGHKGEWASHTIADFLDSSKAWAEDSDFGARPGPKDGNCWKQFAMFLFAGRGYE
jgi:hypothetical protein